MNIYFKIEWLYLFVGATVGLFPAILFYFGYIPDKYAHPESDNKRLNIDVSGAINKPGVYSMMGGQTYAEALVMAGGLDKDADSVWISKNVNLAVEIGESSKLYFPYMWEIEPKVSTLALIAPKKIIKVEESVESVSSLINVNSASSKDLIELSGIGAVYAAKIIDNRPYSNLADLLAKSGLSQSVAEKIKDHIEF